MIYIQLFLSFVQIGLFSVGGGYAAIPLIQSQVVETHGWLTMNEFTNLITIAEMTPGPNRCQFCHIYRSADCWNSRCDCRYFRLDFSFLYSGIYSGTCIL